MSYNDIAVTDNAAIHHYEMAVDDSIAFIDYRLKGDKIYLVHTEVPEALTGRGIAAILVEKALTDIESRKLQLVPLCVYVQGFLKRHPEWERIVAK